MTQGFQLCPKCDGTGNKIPLFAGRIPYGEMLDVLNKAPIPYKDKEGNIQLLKPDNTCPICNGKMIISMLTGKPPKD